jgi:hypothetical protein
MSGLLGKLRYAKLLWPGRTERKRKFERRPLVDDCLMGRLCARHTTACTLSRAGS